MFILVFLITFALFSGCVGPNNDKIFVEKVSLSIDEVQSMLTTITNLESEQDATGLNQASTAMSKRIDSMITEFKNTRVSQKMEPVKSEILLTYASFKKAFEAKAEAGLFFQNNDLDNGIRMNNIADQHFTEAFAHFDASDTLLGSIPK